MTAEKEHILIREAITEAYLDMLEEMPYDKIQAKELAARANVARSTLYHNFGGSLEVLEQVEQDLLSTLNLYQPHEKSEHASAPFDCMKRWFDVCLENSRAIRAITSENGDPYFTHRLTARLKREIDAMMDDDRLPASPIRDYVNDAMASMCVGLMTRAVRDAEDGKPPNSEILAGMVNLIRVAYHNDVADSPSISDQRLYGESAGRSVWRAEGRR